MSANVDGTTRTYPADRAENMAAFDKLPRALRQALAESDHNWSAACLLRARRAKHPAVHKLADAAAFIKTQDAAKHAADAAAGRVAP